MPYWLYVTRGYGFTVEDINWSCPADLEPYANAHRLEIRERDSLNHEMGLYNKIAFEVVMAHFGAGLSGKKSPAKYIDKPFMIDGFEDENNPNREGKEGIAVFEMKKRTNMLARNGLQASPM